MSIHPQGSRGCLKSTPVHFSQAALDHVLARNLKRNRAAARRSLAAWLWTNALVAAAILITAHVADRVIWGVTVLGQ